MELDATVEALAPRLLRYCLGRTGSAEAAEEVAQDALAALVGRWRRHGPPESPAAFAFAVARRRAWRAVVRRRLLLPLAALTDGHGGRGAGIPAELAHPSTARDQEEQAVARGEVARTLAALHRLPGRDREALLLVAGGELATEEAARLLGVSRSAFKMRIHRARKRLSDLLEANDG
jgi:RNA polymerase sigma factor (sigma-70 family)